jgi:hypothetical protein
MCSTAKHAFTVATQTECFNDANSPQITSLASRVMVVDKLISGLSWRWHLVAELKVGMSEWVGWNVTAQSIGRQAQPDVQSACRTSGRRMIRLPLYLCQFFEGTTKAPYPFRID